MSAAEEAPSQTPPGTARKRHRGDRKRSASRAGRGLGKRRAAREMALQMLYQRDIGSSDLPQIFRSFDPGEYMLAGGQASGGKDRLEAAFEFARRLVEGTVGKQEEIDGLISRQADNWRLERMPIVDRNVLRLAVYEMAFDRETPELVVVDEAIELAKKFGSEQSGRFVNGLLDGLLKSELRGVQETET